MGAANDEARAEPAKTKAPEPGEIIADKYRVERVVGVGGMGVVLAAQHLQLGQSVAIKVLSTEETRRTEATARFQREGRAAAGLRSDHVVRIYDVGTLRDGSPFMVMELLRGTDLAGLLDERGPLPTDHAVELIMQACDAIGEAHALGIVHRDLKPSNLFVTRRSDGTALLKVLDFGISKAIRPDETDGALTQTRSVMGSPYYMSPEQVRDAKKVDGRTDVWALGVILHELLTATPAFQADTFPGICAAIVADEPSDIREVRADVPHELIAVIRRCLEKDPRNRFQTVAELVAALRPFAAKGALSTLPAPAVSGPFVSAASVSTEAATVSMPPETSSHSSPRASGAAPLSAPKPSSALPSAAPPARASSSPRRPARSSVALLTAGAFVLGIAAAVALALGRNGDKPPAAVTDRSSFDLTIESVPPAANVIEGGKLVGKTPLRLTIERAAAQREPRRFVVEHAGYLPYSVLQGSSNEDVRIVAALVEEPKPPPEPAASATPSESAAPTEASPPVAGPRRSARPPQRPRATPSETPPAPSLDIRMQR